VYTPRLSVNTTDLFNFGKTGGKAYTVGDFQLVLEGMQRKDNTILLVLHAESPETGARLKVDLSARLDINSAVNGRSEIAGDIWSGTDGTDVVFNIPNPQTFQLVPAEITLNIDRVEMKVPEIDIDINMTKLPLDPDENLLNAKKQIGAALSATPDLTYINEGTLLGTVVEEPGVIHRIKALLNGDNWAVSSNDELR
jgi:hypothetical protein